MWKLSPYINFASFQQNLEKHCQPTNLTLFGNYKYTFFATILDSDVVEVF